MSFRLRLLLVFSLSIALTVLAVALGLSQFTLRAFEDRDAQRVKTLLNQFRRDFNQRSAEVTRRLTRLAEGDAVQRIALDLARPDADPALHYSDAEALANSQGLDLLTIAQSDGRIVSSAQWPARFGYKEDWLTEAVDWNRQAAFLRRETLPEESMLAVVAVRAVVAGDRTTYLAGGQKLDREFLEGLVLPEGMRALLAQSQPGGYSIITAGSSAVEHPEKLNALLDEVRQKKREVSAVIDWTGRPADSEAFTAIPLTGRDGSLMAVLLAGSSRREAVSLGRWVRGMGFGAAAFGVLLGLALAWWAAMRVTRPVNELAEAAQRVAAGDWTSRVPVRTQDELGLLAGAFNQMTTQLSEQRERLVQAERVAAWRELARRLAHELKNPLFPLQITIENLQRARTLAADQFNEVFEESTSTLLAELANLKGIIGRFSDFSKMPKPELQTADINAVVEDAAKLYRGQLAQASVSMQLELGSALPPVRVDAEQFRRVLQNLFLNAIDAMPQGGALIVKTSATGGRVRIAVADTGQGLTPEECARLFTPYYTTKHHGTGLGLAIVQSVVSDHQGTIMVASEPGRGATFSIELPAA